MKIPQNEFVYVKIARHVWLIAIVSKQILFMCRCEFKILGGRIIKKWYPVWKIKEV